MELIVDYNVVDTDFVDADGVLHVCPQYTGNVQIRTSADLTDVAATGHYRTGAMAHTAGFGAVYELGNDGATWTQIGA